MQDSAGSNPAGSTNAPVMQQADIGCPNHLFMWVRIPPGAPIGPVMQTGRHTAFRPQVFAGSTPARPTKPKGFSDMERIEDSICSEIGQDDERAWAAFYDAFAPVLRAYAVRRGCDEPDDAVQDVFVKFVSAVRSGGFQARSAAETCAYLKTQVARQVIDYHRRAKARCRDATVELDGIEIAVPAVVSQVVEAREEAEIRVRARARAVSGWRCSDRTRAIFEACTSGGRTTAEVAREFGVSPGFVRIIRHRGLAKERKAAKRV